MYELLPVQGDFCWVPWVELVEIIIDENTSNRTSHARSLKRKRVAIFGGSDESFQNEIPV